VLNHQQIIIKSLCLILPLLTIPVNSWSANVTHALEAQDLERVARLAKQAAMAAAFGSWGKG